jgi:hypothetical protein
MSLPCYFWRLCSASAIGIRDAMHEQVVKMISNHDPISIHHCFLVLERPPYGDERHLLQVREVPFGVGRAVR